MADPSLPPGPEPAGDVVAVEHRLTSRHSCEHQPIIRLLARPSFQSLTAAIHDLSASGVGLILDRKLEPGTILALQLQGRRRGLSSILSAKVIHARPFGEGNWLMGCKLSQRLRDEDLEALLQNTPAPVETSGEAKRAERQAWVRYHCEPEAAAQTADTKLDVGVCTARLRDITNDGLTLILPRHLKVGAFLAIEFAHSPQGCLPVLLGRVVHATAQSGGDWVIGCEFTCKISNNEVRDLLG